MKKQLVYKVSISVDPTKADVAAILEALEPFGDVEIIGSSMRKVEDKKQ